MMTNEPDSDSSVRPEQLELNYDYDDECNYVDDLEDMESSPTDLTVLQ